ncbi:SDR family oxidoreductase [Gordonia sinesedis]
MADTGRVWFVTGASKGMGLEIVRAALANGDRVVGTSRDAGRLAAAVSADGDIADRFVPVAMSFTPESIAAAVEQAVTVFGRIDVLVNNAGYSLLGAVEEFSPDEVRANFDVNVFGVLEVTQRVLPIMRRQRSGHILTMASISANVTGPATGLYSATKAAVLMLSEALAAEVEPWHIRVTAICPGGVRTDFLDPSSSRHPARRIDDYTNVDAALTSYGRLNHRQGGDPALVAQALLRVADMDDPPTRLYLGVDAVNAITRTTESVLRSVQEYRDLSASIDD